MPATLSDAIHFLETQWSSINDNKLRGILAEVRLKDFLIANEVHFVPGGWILTPGKYSLLNKVPTREKICVLPRHQQFSWELPRPDNHGYASLAAFEYFKHVGITPVFAIPDPINESIYALPRPSAGKIKAEYPKPYLLKLYHPGPNGQLNEVAASAIFSSFPERNGNVGLRCYGQGRIPRDTLPWSDPSIVSDLFWFEYSRYFFQTDYLVSNNDLDLFIKGKSGKSYPVELKSKSPAEDRILGEWFGMDIGPYAKLSFFIANSLNNDALYVVEEVSAEKEHLEWYGIKFSELVKCCSWVGRSGGTGMLGGASSTFRIPKAAFVPLKLLLDEL